MARQQTERGIRLSDLDRQRHYVIAYRGHRWEVLGPVASRRPAAPDSPGPDSGAGDAVASTEPDGPDGPPPREPHALGNHADIASQLPETPVRSPQTGPQQPGR